MSLFVRVVTHFGSNESNVTCSFPKSRRFPNKLINIVKNREPETMKMMNCKLSRTLRKYILSVITDLNLTFGEKKKKKKKKKKNLKMLKKGLKLREIGVK